jgi:hypothetical protein
MSSISSTDGGYQYTKRRVDELENELRNETKRARERADERVDLIEKNATENARKLEKRTDERMQDYRESAAESVEKAREAARADVDRVKAQSYNKYGRTQAELAQHQKWADQAVQQAHDQIERNKIKSEESTESIADKINHASAERLAENARAERDSRTRENATLHKTISQLIQHEGDYKKGKAQGAADARREMENESRTRENVISKQYEDEIEQLKDKATQADRNYALLDDQNRRDMETKFAKTLQRVNQENDDDRRYLSNNAERAIAEARDLADKQGKNSASAMARQADAMARQNENSLTHQADTFRHELGHQRELHQDEVHRLESELTQRRTSSDPTWVAPAAEAKMRDNFIQEYDKKHQAEVTRNQSRADNIRSEYRSRLSSTIEDADQRVTRAELQRRSDEHQQRKIYEDHVQEVQKNAEQAIRDREHETSHQADVMNRTYGNTLEHQRRQYEAMINQLKSDSMDKLTQVRQQAEFDAKIAQRNFATQQYEANKTFERKLEEQKNFYEDTVSQLKDQLTAAHHEAQRRTQQLLDDQAKGYEQKIAEMEYQTKQRERTISDNYQDQIEKLKRTNALLIQRKS